MTSQKYDIRVLVGNASTPLRNHVVYSSFFDNPDDPSLIYLLNDVGNVRDSVRLSVFDLESGTPLSTGTLITTTTEGTNWDVGPNFSGAYCSYNSTILCCLPEKIVSWNDPVATVLETSDRNRFDTKIYAGEQYAYVFSYSGGVYYIAKWDLSTNTLVSEITQPWIPTSPIVWLDYLEDGTAWIRTKSGDFYTGTWDRTGNMVACTDYSIVYTNAGALITNTTFTHVPFRYVQNKDLLIVPDILTSTSADTEIYNYDVTNSTLTLTYTVLNSANRWNNINVDEKRGDIQFDSLWGGEIVVYPSVYDPPTLVVTQGIINLAAVWLPVEFAVAYRLTYTPSGGTETTVLANTTLLEYDILDLTQSSDYDVSIYSSLDGNVFTLVKTISTSTFDNILGNYDTSNFLEGDTFNISSLGASERDLIFEIINDLFSTGDKLDIKSSDGKKLESVFVNRGGNIDVSSTAGVLLPFETSAGTGQDVTFTLTNASTVSISYDEIAETMTVTGSGVYSEGDIFILDGKKITVFFT